VCITTDGAAVMTKVGLLVKCHQQLCYAHGIQLAVQDVLYSNNAFQEISTSFEYEEEINSDNEENDVDGFKISHHSGNSMELIAELRPLIDKVRKVVKK